MSSLTDKLVALSSSHSSTNLRHPSSARIIDSQDIKNVTSESNRFSEDSKAVNPDEVRTTTSAATPKGAAIDVGMSEICCKGKLLPFRLSIQIDLHTLLGYHWH